MFILKVAPLLTDCVSSPTPACFYNRLNSTVSKGGKIVAAAATPITTHFFVLCWRRGVSSPLIVSNCLPLLRASTRHFFAAHVKATAKAAAKSKVLTFLLVYFLFQILLLTKLSSRRRRGPSRGERSGHRGSRGSCSSPPAARRRRRCRTRCCRSD
jgi:hypothetical protein